MPSIVLRRVLHTLWRGHAARQWFLLRVYMGLKWDVSASQGSVRWQSSMRRYCLSWAVFANSSGGDVAERPTIILVFMPPYDIRVCTSSLRGP